MSCQCRCGFTWQQDAGMRTDIVFDLCPLCQCQCGFAWQQDAGVRTDIVFVLCPLCHVSAVVALPDSRMLAWEQILCLFSVHYAMSVPVWLYLTAGCWYENRYCVCSLSIMPCQCRCGFTWQQDAGVRTDIVFVLCPLCHVSAGVALPDSRMLAWEQILCLFSVHYAMSVLVWLCLTAGCWHENRYCVCSLSIMPC